MRLHAIVCVNIDNDRKLTSALFGLRVQLGLLLLHLGGDRLLRQDDR